MHDYTQSAHEPDTPMPMLSVAEAAEAAGVSRTTVYDRLRAGELSKTADGIDPAELMRVFGPLKSDGTDSVADSTQTVTPELVTWLRGLVDQQQATIDRQRQELLDAQTQAADERRSLLDRLDRVTALLPPPAKPELPRGFWSRLFG